MKIAIPYQGWVSSELVEQMSRTSEGETSEGDLRLSANRVNLRSGPGLANPVLTTLPKGLRMEHVDESNGWIEVRFENVGWVYQTLVRDSD